MSKRLRIGAAALALIMMLGLAAGCNQTTPSSTPDPAPESTPDAPSDEMPAEFEPDFELFDAEGNMLRTGRSAKGENGIVTSGRIEASRAGLEIIMAGGNAVDAMVATSFALAVCEPAASGVGGGGFMNIRLADGTEVFLDGREPAPMDATPDLWPVDAEGKVIGTVKTKGATSACVPSHVATLLYALENYGTLSREVVMAPAIRLAEEGFEISPSFAADSESSMGYLKEFNDGEGARIFIGPDGFPYKVGDHFTNPDMANTLKIIRDEGKDGFYTGAIAEAIVEASAESGGVISLEDLLDVRDNQPVVREPVKGTYRGYQIISAAPVSSGGTHIVEILNILENFDMGSYGVNSTEYVHLFSEAFKMAFADRAKYMGDPAFVEDGLPIAGLTDKEYAKALAAQIDMEQSGTYEAGDPWAYESNDTTHISIGDKDGNMVSMTQTVNGYFGSCVSPKGTGFVLNNQCSDFGIGWGLPNSIEGGKKPLSSMSPTIVLTPEGDPFLIVGSPGGTRIFPTVAQMISKCIDYQMPIQEAIDSPRMYDSNLNVLQYEAFIGQEVADELAAMGHEVEAMGEWDRALGSVNAVLYGDDGYLYGGADPRRDGKALAY